VNYSLFSYLTLFAASAFLVGIATPKFRELALRKEIFDSPNSAHKTHVAPVPYLGGIAIVIGVVFVSLIATILTDSSVLGLASGVLLPPVFLAAVGLIDDLRGLEPLPRLIAQTVVGLAVALILIQTDTVGAPTGSPNWDIVITIVFIVGLSNSINFFDNVDGGASGAVAISTFFVFILAYSSGQKYIAAISIVVAGSTIGFLWWNKSPARIYMGDAGSLFLGSLLASILVRFDPKPTSFPHFFFVPLFLVAIPLLDTCTVLISRISRRLSPFKGGRDHLSHRLLRLGIPKVRVVIILWGMATFFGLLAVILSSVSLIEESIVCILGSALWVTLLIFFLRLPAAESATNEN
jgi:UDP-GlcNAc:undecaprenyl-phosphate GlcNAc-1-phosphate transferase